MTSNESLNSLISKGGIASMLNTVWLIRYWRLRVLERTGIWKQILDAVLKVVKSTGDLVLATATGGFDHNILAPISSWYCASGKTKNTYDGSI